MKLITAGALVLLLHTVTAIYEIVAIVAFVALHFSDISRESYSIGDDVTLTCPVTLSPGEELGTVEWAYFSCGRYLFNNYCRTNGIWTKPTYSGPKVIEIADGITMQVSGDRSVKPTLTIKNITCDKSAYYQCGVWGTKGTKRTYRHDVYLFRNASAEPKLTPDPIILPEKQKGVMQFTCVDESHVPGSSIRMYHVYWSWTAAFIEVPTRCTVTYTPNACDEVAICSANITMETLRNQGSIPNSVHCDITRPGGKRVTVQKSVQIKRGP